jgi:hypothetical protein
MSIEGLGPDGILVDGQRPSKRLEAIGQIPLLITENVGGIDVTVWRPTVLLNSVEETGPAWGIYTSDVTISRIGARFWTNRYPSGSPTDEAMPRANVSAMWGDFHLLGDIVWLADRSLTFDANNAARFPHGIWFSQPDNADSWDPVDVQFIGQQADDNKILGMFPVTAGLIVVSTNGAHMLRGNPDFNEYEQIRVGIGPNGRRSVTFWPAAGVVVWVDKRGQIWQTNGEDFGRLDTVLPDVTGPCPSSVVAFDDFLLVSRAGRVYALRLYQGQGIWTELNAPCIREMHRYEGSIYTARTVQGGLERFAPEFGARGTFEGVPIGSRVTTATLQPPDQHKKTFWHRFGFRTDGTGRLLRAKARSGPLLDQTASTVEYALDDTAGDRQNVVFPAHGPSKEAAFTLEAEGDVIFEGATVWSHSGRDAR